MVDRVISFADGMTTLYPKTTAALSSLRLALGEEMPRQRVRATQRSKRKADEPADGSRKHYYKCRRLEKANTELLAKVASFTAANVERGDQ